MSLYTVAKRLTGVIPGTPLTLAQDSVYKALESIYDQMDWSWSKGFSGWLCPGMLFNTGTTTTTPYSPAIIADATLTALLAAYAGQPFITQLQYRNPSFAAYNIIAYDTTSNAPFATLTLDRPWMEPTSGPGQPFFIYQVYYAAPVQDFRKFIEIRDPISDGSLDFWSMTQADLSRKDPQRLDFSNPRYVIPVGIDQRPNSATLGWQMFELWPHQGNYVPYSFSYRNKGPLPQNASDWMTMTAPYPITESMVEWRAREVLCQFKEAQKGQEAARGSGANWILLSQMAQKEYAYLLGESIAIDLNLDGQQQSQVGRRAFSQSGPYATMGGRLNLGGYPDS